MIKLNKIVGFFIFPVLVLTFHVIIMLFTNAYRFFPWFDIPMHVLGGISVGCTFVFILRYIEKETPVRLGNLKFVFIISLVALTAVLWEFFEFSLGFFTGISFQGNLEDTLADLFLGLAGGTFIALLSSHFKSISAVK